MRLTLRPLSMIAAATGLALLGVAPTAQAIDEEHYRKARQMIEKSIDYLRTQQDAETGGWSVPEQGPNIPAISALVLNGMLMEPDIDHTDPTVASGLEYLYSFQQDDGGIYDVILANYNTAITVSALAHVNTAEAGEAIERAIPFLKRLQWSEDAIPGREDTAIVDRSHPYYGGVGYGGSGRPDNSNLNLMLQALHDAGVDCEDPAFQRALVFLQRTQMLHKDKEGNVINDMPYAAGSQQGGFIYATSPDQDNVGAGESKAGTIEETLSDGTVASRFRAYGSVTYAGFKSYIYADLDRDDPRVQAAYDWIRENYTLEENPGIGSDGYYYFLIMMSRALDAWGLDQIEVLGSPIELVFSSGEYTLRKGETIEVALDTGIAAGGGKFVFDRPVCFGTIGHVESEMTVQNAKLADGRPYKIVEVPGHTSKSNANETTKTGSEMFKMVIRIEDQRDWANDLIDKLAELQNEDGSFRSIDDRWMEDNPVLITAYSLIALQHAIN